MYLYILIPFFSIIALADCIKKKNAKHCRDKKSWKNCRYSVGKHQPLLYPGSQTCHKSKRKKFTFLKTKTKIWLLARKLRNWEEYFYYVSLKKYLVDKLVIINLFCIFSVSDSHKVSDKCRIFARYEQAPASVFVEPSAGLTAFNFLYF